MKRYSISSSLSVGAVFYVIFFPSKNKLLFNYSPIKIETNLSRKVVTKMDIMFRPVKRILVEDFKFILRIEKKALKVAKFVSAFK